jgi:hypothetical protein
MAGGWGIWHPASTSMCPPASICWCSVPVVFLHFNCKQDYWWWPQTTHTRACICLLRETSGVSLSGGRDRSRENPAALDSSRSRGVEGAKVRPGMGSRETIRPRWEPNGREKGLAVIPIACGNSSPCLLSVRKVVPTITSKSAEIYLSMAGAKQHNDTGLSWFRPWAVRPAAVRLGRCIAVHCGACGGE